MQVNAAERPNDPFDRQRCLADWDQTRMERQVALVLGVGALGCGVALALARLGVKKMILLDYDVVDVSNLNRQILFSKTDVGRHKVDAAADGVRLHIVGATEVVAIHHDVLNYWGQLVRLCKREGVTVIFNNIDIGAYFDYACISLGKHLRIPVAAGSSYGRTWLTEYFSGKRGSSSFSYLNKEGDKVVFEKLHPSKIHTYETLNFVTVRSGKLFALPNYWM
eukprot:TRINITY_DN3920_c0_g3_i1.p1 TRINITY_DN3920_c0_g3~~TRINITY_DN3920_c0_g3_i1.p1  ORF type:complete len:222 (+),score=62.66 TRINITY_DN3920_c0_g3_i1:86-751(+)